MLLVAAYAIFFFQQIAYFFEQFDIVRFGRWCGSRFFLGFLRRQRVDEFDRCENHDGDNQEVDGDLYEIAPVECYCRADDRSACISYCIFHRPFEVAEIQSADEQSDRRHDNV